METTTVPNQPLQNIPFSNKKNTTKIFPIVILIGVAICVWTWINSPLVVTVTGMGEVSTPASTATINYTISTIDVTAEGAITSIKTKAKSTKEFLMRNGVLEQDISESQINTVPASAVTSGASGYQSLISISAKTINVSRISDIVSGLYAFGAYMVSQPVLGIEKTDKLEADALAKALDNAKKEADALAWKNMKFIKKIIAISQETTSTSTTKNASNTSDETMPTSTQNDIYRITKIVSVSYKMW